MPPKFFERHPGETIFSYGLLNFENAKMGAKNRKPFIDFLF